MLSCQQDMIKKVYDYARVGFIRKVGQLNWPSSANQQGENNQTTPHVAAIKLEEKGDNAKSG